MNKTAYEIGYELATNQDHCSKKERNSMIRANGIEANETTIRDFESGRMEAIECRKSSPAAVAEKARIDAIRAKNEKLANAVTNARPDRRGEELHSFAQRSLETNLGMGSENEIPESVKNLIGE